MPFTPEQTQIILRVALTLLAAFGVAFCATPVARYFAVKTGAVDVPTDMRRMHTSPVPRLGGLAIFLGFICGVVFFAELNRQLRGILIGCAVIVAIGALDDVFELTAVTKLIVQIIAAVIACEHGIVIGGLANPLAFFGGSYLMFGPVLSYIITVVWIVLITNAVNLIDGLDGLAVGVSAISSVTTLIIALLVSDINIAVIAAAIAGACFGFLPFNFNPAKIFMGDSGALLLGFVLSTVSITGLFKFYAVVSFAVPFFVIGLPLIDAVIAICRRVLKGQNPMSPDKKHLHHRLLEVGLTQKQAVVIMYVVSTLLGLIAVVMTTSGETRALVLA
ncbi:MAG: undecaprenyl/decaprenyl-phosphate alpha-N-acetylglucosaminyl 1-phosphate transferase, partial [Oscillospiraceae bacterium]|nr:undecaprenyl/decaprenyl-phosphate alpha-N-acetylglucosaminyl 1-phosphate transferase [Oscillospiraceae bacterium]